MTVNKTDSGYVFPNIPRQWQREERFFALELRNLFDRLFQLTKGLNVDPDKLSYEKISKKPKISGHELRPGNNTLSEIGVNVVTNTVNGLMSSAMKIKLDGIQTDARNDRPELDYLFMMTEVDLPTDTSNKKTKLTGYYNTDPKRWTKPMIWDAVNKNWITASDYQDITGETHPAFRPT